MRATSYVLATGGLENARLLLTSNSQLPPGVGNQHDGVGRYYQDHLKLGNGILRPGPALRDYAGMLKKYPSPNQSFCLSLAEPVCREHELLRHSYYFGPKYQHKKKRPLFRFPNRIHDGRGQISHYSVIFTTEQVPHRESRLTLSEQRDPLGMPRLNVNWKFTRQDHTSAQITCELMEKLLQDVGFGKITWPEGPPSVESMVDSAHPTSTTRMSTSPDTGVVSPDLRVFGHDNLFIVGSSVFPNGSVYAPTFTILLLARKLAHELAGPSS